MYSPSPISRTLRLIVTVHYSHARLKINFTCTRASHDLRFLPTSFHFLDFQSANQSDHQHRREEDKRDRWRSLISDRRASLHKVFEIRGGQIRPVGISRQLPGKAIPTSCFHLHTSCCSAIHLFIIHHDHWLVGPQLHWIDTADARIMRVVTVLEAVSNIGDVPAYTLLAFEGIIFSVLIEGLCMVSLPMFVAVSKRQIHTASASQH